ncbi:hypothetical protein LTS08_001181 [Lithohypha guttulata]|uniref:uncharacterized protein n=1 Tax=Lithohypha guttulata TaxID=1690604 RepID=UPI002DE00CEF|nr:hypothetical protein LTR51_007817 [Lithohypha guttulata]KAK5104910.1 hypothetical protein LTS08_001181 [Lithohypha guttulata]
MPRLQNHLDHINLSAKSIDEIQFPPSRPFTNALVYSQEITLLIRDTEPHEKGLFSTDPNIKSGRDYGHDTAGRRKTVASGSQTHSSAVARVLGNDLVKKIQSSNRFNGRARGVDVEVLLHGVERLCSAHSLPGATDRIAALRSKNEKLSSSIKRYEDKIVRQQSSLTQSNASSIMNDAKMPEVVAEAHLKAEEEAIKDLEARKKELETRIAEMERDLGGLRA